MTYQSHTDEIPRTHLLGYFLVSLGALFYCYEFFIRVSPSVMKPELMDAFSINATAFGALSAYYFYAYTPMQLVVGVLVDRYNPRITMTLAVAACAMGSWLFYVADSFVLASVGRFLQGFGSAFAFVGTLKIAATWLPRSRFAFFCGISSSLGFLGAAFGEIVISQIVRSDGWRHSFLAFAVAGAALTVCFWLALGKKPDEEQSTDDAATMGDFRECAREFKEVIKHRRVWLSGAISYLMFLPTSVFAGLWGIPYMEEFHKYDASQAALVVSLIFVGWAIGAPLTGWASDYLRNRIILVRIGSLLSLVLIAAILYVQSLGYTWLCILCTLFGITSSVQALTFVMAGDLVPKRAVGTAVAFVNMLSMLGGLIFQRGIGQLLDWGWDGKTVHGIRVYSIEDYEQAMLVMPACFVLSTLIALFMRDTPHPDDHDQIVIAPED